MIDRLTFTYDGLGQGEDPASPTPRTGLAGAGFEPAWGGGGEREPVGAGLFAFNQRLPGQYLDKETGLFYNMERDYDPATGRYVQPDPLGIAWDVNLYPYVRANPLSLSDSMGLGPSDKTFGLPKDFWNWYHRQMKKPGDPDLTKKEAKELFDEWKSQDKPGPDKKGKRRFKLPKGRAFCTPLLIFDVVQEYCMLNPGDPACFFALPPDPRDPCKGDPFCA